MTNEEAYQEYLKDVARDRLDANVRNRLLADYKCRFDFAARDRFVAAQAHWCLQLFRRTFGQCDSLVDLAQDALLDVIDLVETYRLDNEKGASFRTYCRPILLHHAWLRLSQYKDGYAAPEATRKRAIHLHRFYNDCIKAGMSPVQAEEATVVEYCVRFATHNYADMSPAKRDKARERTLNLLALGSMAVSLDAPVGDDEDSGSYVDDCADADGISPEDMACDDETARVVRAAVESLTPRQRYVMVHRFGIYDEEKLNFSQMAKRLAVSRQRVCTVYAEAQAKLRVLLLPYYENVA